jgi:DNA-binding response OmpR family regulator
MCVVENGVLNFAETASPLTYPLGTARVISGKPLPAIQAALLRYFRQHTGRTIGREELAEQVWRQRHFYGSRAIDQAVANLRKRLRDDEKIVSVWSSGYRFESQRAR